MAINTRDLLRYFTSRLDDEHVSLALTVRGDPFFRVEKEVEITDVYEHFRYIEHYITCRKGTNFLYDHYEPDDIQRLEALFLFYRRYKRL